MKNLILKINILIISCLFLITTQGCKKAESGQFELSVPSYTRLPYDTKLDAVEWTEGFWHEYMLRLREIYIPGTLDGSYMSTMNGAIFRNFLRAAGMEEGGAIGRIWGDGDCYLVLDALNRLAENLLAKKIFITGAVAPIGLGMRPERTVKGVAYESVRMGESIGEAYDLPGENSYCESCGQCLFMEWFYEMFRLTGKALYMDAAERMLYNTTMGTADLNRPNFFYSNPQEQGPEANRRHEWVPETRGNEDHLTWTRTYSKLCACCPPKIMRAIAMTPAMAYDINDEGVWVNLYGSNKFRSKLPWGGELECVQTTNYPWEGKVKIELTGVNSDQNFPLFLRIRDGSHHPLASALMVRWLKMQPGAAVITS